MADYPSLSRSPFFKTFIQGQPGQPGQSGQAGQAGQTGRAGSNNRVRSTRRASRSAGRAGGTGGGLRHYPFQAIQPIQQAIPPQRPMASMQQAMPPQSPMTPMQQPMPPQSPMLAHSSIDPAVLMAAHPPQTPVTPSAPLAPPEPLAPQVAAQRFQQVNKGLPDGVKFEPMDEETKTALKMLGMTPSQPATATPEAPAPATPAPAEPVQTTGPQQMQQVQQTQQMQQTQQLQQPHQLQQAQQVQASPTPQASSQSVTLLEKLIQDERNASIYYQHLSTIAPTDTAKTALQDIVKECEGRLSSFHGILKDSYNREFEPKNTAINTSTGFSQGVGVAVSEERKILEAMADLIGQLNVPGASQVSQVSQVSQANQIQNMLNKRMIRHNWLQWASISQSFA